MDNLIYHWFADQLTEASLRANLIVSLNLVGALALGFVVGYERSYHGRAAGMRTYGLMCMASAALTMVAGHPEFWYISQKIVTTAAPDPTRVIQGIVTGVGFLCAGVIMKDGLNISGLTTSASMWVASVIGIIWGLELYVTALMLSALSLLCMMWVGRLESWLPSRPAIAVSMTFAKGIRPDMAILRKVAKERGYDVAGGSFTVEYANGCEEWRFVALAHGQRKGASLTALSADLSQFEGVEKYHFSHARN